MFNVENGSLNKGFVIHGLGIRTGPRTSRPRVCERTCRPPLCRRRAALQTTANRNIIFCLSTFRPAAAAIPAGAVHFKRRAVYLYFVFIFIFYPVLYRIRSGFFLQVLRVVTTRI